MAVNVGQPISHRLDHMLSGVRAEIALKVYGEDLDALRRVANALRDRMAAIPGLADLQVERQVRIPQLEVRVDYTRAALYGVQPAAVVEQISACRTDGWSRRWSTACAASTWSCGCPRTVGPRPALAISSWRHPRAGFRRGRWPTSARRTGRTRSCARNARRRIVVQANTDGGSDMATIVAAIREAVAKEPLPPGFFTSLDGTFQAQEEGEPNHRGAVRAVLGPGLRHPVQPLPLGRPGAHHHGQTCPWR